MIQYKIYSENPHNHFLNIEMVIDNIKSNSIELQLPAWRPGRYELQHFAKNIQRFEIVDFEGILLNFHKLTKDRWLIHTGDLQKITVKFTYFANVQNAGSSYIDEGVMYVNFVNCLPYVQGRMDEPCEVLMDIPKTYKIACGVRAEGNVLKAKNYYL